MSDHPQLADVRKTIQEWLIGDHWSVRDEPQDDAIWSFLAEDRLGRKIIVGQRVGSEDSLIIQASINFGDASDKIAQLPSNDRERFLWDLRFGLLRTDLEFGGIEIPLERVNVGIRIFFDSLTKSSFFHRVSQVRKGLILVQWMVADRLVEEPPQIGFER